MIDSLNSITSIKNHQSIKKRTIMRYSLLLLVVFEVLITNIFCIKTDYKLKDTAAVSTEIQRLLEEQHCDVEKDVEVTVFFSLSEDKKIQCLSVASPDKDINQLIEKKFANKDLSGNSWREGKIYELSVVRKMKS